jgi:cobalt-precorrin-5B (C1)-methyltransferase
MEIIAAAALREGADRDALLGILDSMTTDEDFAVLSSRGLVERVSSRLMDSIAGNLRRRAQDSLEIECIMYTKELGQLAATQGAAGMIELCREQWNG